MLKSVIIYESVHHGNTKKIAEAMAEVLGAKTVKANKFNATTLSRYDVIGFGSGIFFCGHHHILLRLAERLPSLDKKVFVFSTSGLNLPWLFHQALKNKLMRKGFKLVGEFSCRGFDTYGPLKVIGGISKGHPNKRDVEKAKEFAQRLCGAGAQRS